MIPLTILNMRRMSQVCKLYQISPRNLHRGLLPQNRIITQFRLDFRRTPRLAYFTLAQAYHDSSV